MKILKQWFIASLLIPGLAGAANVKARTAKPASEIQRSRRHSSNVAINAHSWHESIDLKQDTSTSKMLSQIKSLMFAYDFNLSRPGSLWHYWFGIDVGAGLLKGKGAGPLLDQFNDQPMILAAARLGMVYRSSPAARVGIFIPATYRQIQWAYDKGSSIKAADQPFSAGVGLVYQLRLTKKIALQSTLVRQHMWNANIWGVGLNLEL